MSKVSPPSPPPPARRLPWWRWINLLALDAVLVALVWLKVFGDMTGARLESVEFAALGVAVWVIYGADRLLDSRLPPEELACGERHWFTARQACWLVPLALGLLAAVTWWALHDMGQNVFRGGMALGMSVAVYFAVLAASRWKATSLAVLLAVAPVMTGLLLSPLLVGLVQPEGGWRSLWPQAWRLAAAGMMMGALWSGMRKRGEGNPPWTLFRKLMGGFLFARGVALAPVMHFESGAEMLWQAPVMLFGAVCAMNSLGIRIWEHGGRGLAEDLRLSRMYPWMAMIVIAGALTEALVADKWARPVLLACAGAAAAFAVLHFLRFRLKPVVLPALADAVVFVAGLGAWLVLSRL